jgi:RimJ/RimL family protein N-acetyltransferase
MMCPEATTVSALLDAHRYATLAAALGDTPLTTLTLQVLRTGACRVYLDGEPSRPKGVIVQADAMSEEPTGYGSDPEILWALLQQASGWTCVDVDYDCAPPLGAMIERATGASVRYLEDIYFVLDRPAPSYRHPAVRVLTAADLPLLEAAPPELHSSLWGSARTLMSEGTVACAIVDGEIVATALCSGRSERYADVGVYTRQEYRGLGLSTAAAALVAGQVQARGLIPTWSTGGHNTASLRVAQKLGFVEVARRQYVILVTAPHGR